MSDCGLFMSFVILFLCRSLFQTLLKKCFIINLLVLLVSDAIGFAGIVPPNLCFSQQSDVCCTVHELWVSHWWWKQRNTTRYGSSDTSQNPFRIYDNQMPSYGDQKQKVFPLTKIFRWQQPLCCHSLMSLQWIMILFLTKPIWKNDKSYVSWVSS